MYLWITDNGEIKRKSNCHPILFKKFIVAHIPKC